ncbi:MAG: hypothetical protein RL556_16 [Actinomycetota bacterium]|jgi:hypothetical protein
MAKDKAAKATAEEAPYVIENSKPKNSRKPFLKSRGFKIAAIAAGGTLALGAAFGIGLSAGHLQGPDFSHSQFGQGAGGFGDRDGDHGMSGFGPGGHGEKDPNFKPQAPGAQSAPNGSATPNGTATPGAPATNP